MKNGQIVEPEASRLYEFDRGVKVVRVGFCTTDDGRIGCSPDAMVGDDGAVEIKSPLPATHVRWFIDGGVPDDHLCQCHGTLIVTGRAWTDFMSHCKGFPPLIVRIERNEFTENLAVAIEKFLAMYDTIERQLNWSLPKDENAELTDMDHPF
jgi:hypothetical protein